MAPNQPADQPSPPGGSEDPGRTGPQAHGASAAPPPYGTPPGQYGQGTDAGADTAAPRHEQQPGYSQGGYPQGGYPQPGYAQGAHPYYQQGPPPGPYQQGYPQGYGPGYPAPYGWPEPKSRLAAGLLGIFLGGLGIHRFYLGYTTLGIVQLLVTVFTFGLGAIWGFVEGIMILAGAQPFRVDARGVPLRE
ncbi:MAG: NINE protein [Arthrobacter sp.]